MYGRYDKGQYVHTPIEVRNEVGADDVAVAVDGMKGKRNQTMTMDLLKKLWSQDNTGTRPSTRRELVEAIVRKREASGEPPSRRPLARGRCEAPLEVNAKDTRSAHPIHHVDGRIAKRGTAPDVNIVPTPHTTPHSVVLATDDTAMRWSPEGEVYNEMDPMDARTR